MRLCARAQPAHIRMTRRRSVLPSPSSSIPKEGHVNGCSEGSGHGDGLPSRGLTTVVPYQPRSGARVQLGRRGHEAAPPAERRLRREGWCRRKLQLRSTAPLDRAVYYVREALRRSSCPPRLGLLRGLRHRTVARAGSVGSLGRRSSCPCRDSRRSNPRVRLRPWLY